MKIDCAMSPKDICVRGYVYLRISFEFFVVAACFPEFHHFTLEQQECAK